MLRTVRGVLAALVVAASLSAQKPELYDLDVVRDIKLTFSQTNYWQLLTQNKASNTNIPATMEMSGETLQQVGVRFRGNTSYSQLPAGSEKKSFNIETDWSIPSQKIFGYTSLNLNNGFHDPTFVREVIMYQIMRRYGAAPKANFVRLWINNVYWGIYINVEQPGKDFTDENWKTGDGNRYRGFRSGGFGRLDDCALVDLGDNIASYQSAYQFKKGDGTDLLNLVKVMNRTPTAQLQDELSKVWSLDHAYWYMIVMNVMMQSDSYIGSGKDHFLYADDWHGLFYMFPFDLNEGLSAEGDQTALSPFYNSTNVRRPALSRTLTFADWRARYVAHYRTVVEESQSWAAIGPLVTKYQNLIRADVAADTKKIYTTQMFTDNVTQSVVFGRTTIRGIKPSIDARTTYLQGQSELWATQAQLGALQHTPVSPSAQDTVWVTVSASGAAQVKLWWRVRGRFTSTQMFDDGAHQDGAANDGVYGASIAPQAAGSTVEYYVEGLTAAQVARYLPRSAEWNAPSYEVRFPSGTSPVRINEFMASNSKTIVDEKQQYDDWLELYNDSATAVDVGGHYLSDDPTRPTKYQIPASTVIPAFKTILIWCDEDGTQGPLHANFKLSASGEDIYFFAPNGTTLLDSIQFGLQYTDVSTGRLVDGKAPYVTFLDPSPTTANKLTTGHRRYSALDPATHPIEIAGVGSPKIAGTLSWSLSSGPASSVFALFLTGAGGNVPVDAFGLSLLVADPMFFVLVLPSDASGAGTLSIPVPDDTALVGAHLFGQAFSPVGSGWRASNAIESVLGPK
ncbi:MAG: CotH kinase family protein [Planctomycetes bacterium]|nr:CotH kinase family protein [Planctomycetota bacterium]MCB9920320.1 CotH kinase family protein [Planctomycetota bacterium]